MTDTTTREDPKPTTWVRYSAFTSALWHIWDLDPKTQTLCGIQSRPLQAQMGIRSDAPVCHTCEVKRDEQVESEVERQADSREAFLAGWNAAVQFLTQAKPPEALQQAHSAASDDQEQSQ